MKYYKEKSGLYLLVLLLFPLYFYFVEKKTFGPLGMSLAILLNVFGSIHSNLIRENTLKIHRGLFSCKYISIDSILTIERRKFNIKSKYFSFDKIVLILSDGEEFKISPKEEQNFIQHLLSINPNIEIKI